MLFIAQVGWQNIPNLSQREVCTILMGHPVYIDYLSDRLDAAVGDDGDSEPPGVLRDLVDRGGLGPPHRHHLLRYADRARAHPHTQGVGLVEKS